MMLTKKVFITTNYLYKDANEWFQVIHWWLWILATTWRWISADEAAHTASTWTQHLHICQSYLSLLCTKLHQSSPTQMKKSDFFCWIPFYEACRSLQPPHARGVIITQLRIIAVIEHELFWGLRLCWAHSATVHCLWVCCCESSAV